MAKKRLVAKLNEQGHLVGATRRVPKKDDVVLPDDCDLPLDGTYKWAAGPDGTFAFWPLGTGFERVPTRPPVSDDYALYDVVRSLGDSAPRKAREWADWYERHIAVREEEKQMAIQKKARR